MEKIIKGCVVTMYAAFGLWAASFGYEAAKNLAKSVYGDVKSFKTKKTEEKVAA